MSSTKITTINTTRCVYAPITYILRFHPFCDVRWGISLSFGFPFAPSSLCLGLKTRELSEDLFRAPDTEVPPDEHQDMKRRSLDRLNESDRLRDNRRTDGRTLRSQNAREVPPFQSVEGDLLKAGVNLEGFSGGRKIGFACNRTAPIDKYPLISEGH